MKFFQHVQKYKKQTNKVSSTTLCDLNNIILQLCDLCRSLHASRVRCSSETNVTAYAYSVSCENTMSSSYTTDT